MIVKLTCLILFFIVLSITFIQAQENEVLARAFRPKNPNDKFSILVENENISRPLADEATYSITITVTDIRNKNGVLYFKFYDKSAPFPHDKGFLKIVVPKSEIMGDTFTATYDGFTSKTMGISLLDDENNNLKLDMGWIFPKEGHAFSDYYHKAYRRPVYSDFQFTLTGDKEVMMKMKYY
ncbi:MAG: DUF2141 domain-containing protein [Cyclobacteriaceae bacterium]